MHRARPPARPAPSAPHAAGLALSALLMAGLALPALAADAVPRLNGFALAPSAISVAEILRGGPPRDGIPALESPRTVAAADAAWPDDERVIGVALAGQARAYPLSLLVWHELVNDRLGGRPILVSFCPLCGTALVFDRRVGGDVLRFGVSGLLYRSDLLMFDRESESLWSQLTARAETGPRLGQRLALVRSRLETWGRWRRQHPGTTVLSRETGHRRDYDRSPYGDYDRSPSLLFPVARDDRYHPKLPILGLRRADGRARAYPASELRRAGGRVRERFAGHEVEIRYDLEAQVFEVEAPAELEVIESYWFAWVAFHPATEVYTAE